jgi:hypothetical protein
MSSHAGLGRILRLAVVVFFLAVRQGAGQESASGGFHLFGFAGRETSFETLIGPNSYSLGIRAFPDQGQVGSDAFLWTPLTRATSGTDPAARKNFWTAAGEVLFLDFLVWFGNRYVGNFDYARVSPATWSANIHHAWIFDNDTMSTGSLLHPFHGSLYFASARVNGYSFWESIAFANGGSLLWEYFAENGYVDYNNVIYTTFGGAAIGESMFRLSRMVLNNTASGSSRFWSEVGGAILSPASFFDRLVKGQLNKDFPNPVDRFPNKFVLTLDAGAQRVVGGGSGVRYPDQAALAAQVRYGEPFDGSPSKPFEVFEASLAVLAPSQVGLTRLHVRGSLIVGEVDGASPAEHRFGVFLGYDYWNDQVQLYSGPDFTARFLSRFPLPGSAEVRTDVAAGVVTLSALQTDYPHQERVATDGRIYDFGVSGEAEVSARIRRRDVDLVTLGYQALWMRTTNGIGHDSTLQLARIEARLPLGTKFAAGAGWFWDHRTTSYNENPTTTVSHSVWRLFGACVFR